MNTLIISPDRKTAYTLNASGEVLTAAEIQSFEYLPQGYGLKIAGQDDPLKMLLLPNGHSDLPWMQDREPLDYPVSSIKKIRAA